MTNWWVVVPQAEVNSNTRPKDAIVISTEDHTSANDTLFGPGGPVGHGGRNWWRYMGPFPTRKEAGGAQPGTASIVPGGLLNQSPGGAFSGPLKNPLTGLAAIGDFFQRLGQPATWIRVGEVLLGLALIVVGLAKLAEGTPVGNAALKAGKVAALL
jgi:hypothetical protein